MTDQMLAETRINIRGESDIVVATQKGRSLATRLGFSKPNQFAEDGFSSGDGLGLGLSGAKRLMDEFSMVSEIGIGTRIMMTKQVVSI